MALGFGHPLEVVVADDDVRMCHAVAEVLRLEGCNVEEVSDGEELLRCIARRDGADPLDTSVDIVIADVRMPRVGGLDALLRIHGAHAQLPVLLMTAEVDRDLRRRVRELGGALLQKPFTCDALCAAVRAEIEAAQGRA